MEKFIKETIREAGEIILEGFQKKLEISEKRNRADVVTQYDLKSEKFIVDQIQKSYPDIGILAEERGEIKKSQKFFLIDPLDATRNYSRGIPTFCVMIGYIEGDDVVFATIYDPIHDDMYFAEKGKGTTLNDEKISVSGATELKRAMVAVSASDPNNDHLIKMQEIARKHTMWLQANACSGLSEAYVSDGKYDAVIRDGKNPWDCAMGALIIQEAGGIVTNKKGEPYNWRMSSLLGANPEMHEKLIKELNN